MNTGIYLPPAGQGILVPSENSIRLGSDCLADSNKGHLKSITDWTHNASRAARRAEIPVHFTRKQLPYGDNIQQGQREL